MENLLLYGGFGAAALGILLLLILVPVFSARRRKLMKRIENGEEV